MKPLTHLAVAVLPLLAVGAAGAQELRGAVITGTITDSLRNPVEGVDVFIRPSGRRTRSDAAGRYTISDLDKGGYVVSVRKVGFAAQQVDLSLGKGGRLEQNFVMARAVAKLDTIRVTASGKCEGFSLAGFECRKRMGKGLFLDYPDIDAKDQRLTADLFRTIPGFRVQLRSTRSGVQPVVLPAKGHGCITEYVDGKPRSVANPVPERSIDLAAMEVYSRSDSIAIADTRYIWKANEVTMQGRCAVVFYWTIWAPIS